MKYRFIAVTVLMLALSALPSFAKSKKPRSAKVSLDAISTVKKAQSLAQNYEIAEIHSSDSDKETIFAAYNDESKECVFFYTLKDINISYRYYNINGKAESVIMRTFPDAQFILTNSAEKLKFSSSVYDSADEEALNGNLLILIAQRQALRESLAKGGLKIESCDEINPAQPTVHIEMVNGQPCYTFDK